jgi:hypothetical protein
MVGTVVYLRLLLYDLPSHAIREFKIGTYFVVRVISSGGAMLKKPPLFLSKRLQNTDGESKSGLYNNVNETIYR